MQAQMLYQHLMRSHQIEVSYWVRHEFLPIFEFAAIFLPLFLSSNDRKQKSVVNKDKKEKKPKSETLLFLGTFYESKMRPLQTIRALMYWPKPVPVMEKGRERQKKRDRVTERACDGPKRGANYGPSLPVSIPTLGESLA